MSHEVTEPQSEPHKVPRIRRKLSQKQATAIEHILAGETDEEVATAIGTCRETVNRWRNQNDTFIAELVEQQNRFFRSRAFGMRARHARIGERLVETGVKGLELVDAAISPDLLPSVSDVTKLIETGIKAERQASGEPDQTIQTESRSLEVSVDLGAADMAEVAKILRESRGLDMIPGASAQLPQPNGNGHPRPLDDPGNGSPHV